MMRANLIALKNAFKSEITQTRFYCSEKVAAKEYKTALYSFHKQNGGKIINFGGYLLPVSYADQTLVASHLHTRKNASIFDVSHMLQTYIYGKDAISCFEELCTADIRGAVNGTGSLTVFTNPSGGILDDLIVTKVNEKTLYIVSNAAMKEQDKNIMQSAISKYKSNAKDVSIEFLSSEDQSLIALQGPTAASTLKKCLNDDVKLENLYFMQSISANVAGINNCRITRCGYTGEDGFEISVPSEKVENLTKALLSTDTKCLMAGLGSRDSLRLEAGLCLYGSDINEQTTPVEASLSWLVTKRRRAEKNFPGAEHICAQLEHKEKNLQKCRVGIICTGKGSLPPARAGAAVYYKDTLVGHVTSGGPSPSLQKNIAMAYVNRDLCVPGTAIQLLIRNKSYNAEITRMPFVKTNYYLRPKK